MMWSRCLVPRVAVFALLGLASIAGTGDLALPDEHFLFEPGASPGHAPVAHSASPHDSGPLSDTHPDHTCHCVHAHGLALVAAGGGDFTVEAPVSAAPVQPAGTPARSTTSPPFHPPKTLS